jgi:hypothetical protein
MHPSDEQAPLYRLVRKLEHEELQAWRAQHCPSLTLEGAMAQRITEVTTEIKRRPGGNIMVTVWILAKHAFECETNVFRLQRAGNRMWRIVAPDESSTSE